MTARAQAQAYAAADFSEPHSSIMHRFRRAFPSFPQKAAVADLGCGPADIAIRIAGAYSDCNIDAIDGSRAMLDCAKEAVKKAGLADRIHLLQATLPDPSLPPLHYDVIASNSLLHHLHDPQTLWETIKAIAKPGAALFISDLRRPDSERAAKQMVRKYAANEPGILQRDFYRSLLAAFTPQELRAQLMTSNLDLTIETPGDHHLIAWGRPTTAAGK